ncbi:transglutaminase domain-containing protein, partial [Mycobacterium tuberculosis]|nr:transglutaminase domain-containing protein [Mycobacterium tuberculosis]
QAYRARADDKLAVTPEIQALADELTKDVPGRREQTQRIYNWVRGNIRYVALYLAQGGYVPHPAGDILRNRYGDCKD